MHKPSSWFGQKQKLEQLIQQLSTVKAVKTDDLKESLSIESSELQQKTEEYLKVKLAHTLKFPVEKLDSRSGFERYGIDSLMILKLIRELEKEFGDLPKTLFFEYQTISALAGYFVENYAEELATKLVVRPKRATLPISEPSVSVIRPVLARHRAPLAEKDSRIHKDDIAIIGLSGQYPEAKDIDVFWENLKAGKDCIREIPKDRWNIDAYYDPDKNKLGSIYSRWGGFIEDVDKFDPLFFNISPREAELMDPQERLFLETTWRTLEDAGYTREELAPQKIGVFVGVMYGEYQLYGAEESLKSGSKFALSSSYATIPNRVSYYCNFHGPSIALDTMCSSSLTAIHLACESIQKGESDLAIAGGVNVTIHPNKYLLLSQGKFLSSDGHCDSFGVGGDGYVPGEGVGAVLLKRLSQALADGDHIYGSSKEVVLIMVAKPMAIPFLIPLHKPI